MPEAILDNKVTILIIVAIIIITLMVLGSLFGKIFVGLIT